MSHIASDSDMSTEFANEQVDNLREVMGADTDQDFAKMIGVERSTIAQWRRRNGVPARWAQAILSRSFQKHADEQRFRVFGAGDGYFLVMAALALMATEEFDWEAAGLTEISIGDMRMQKVLRAVSYIAEQASENPVDDFDKCRALVKTLSEPEHRARIKERLGGEW